MRWFYVFQKYVVNTVAVVLVVKYIDQVSFHWKTVNFTFYQPSFYFCLFLFFKLKINLPQFIGIWIQNSIPISI